MGILGFLQFALKLVDLFAWPMFALAYPLFASIRAIETNSNYHMRKLVTYWILFSLISLFELTFVKVIEWFPLWAYIKIIAICWLVIPRFGHAYNTYKTLVQMRSYVKVQVFIDLLNKQDKEPFPKTEETFLSVAEKFIKENGSEALEELIANKSKGANPNLDTKEKTGVTITEKKEMASTIKSKGANPNLDMKEKTGVTITEKKEMASTIESKGANPNLDTKEKTGVTITEKKEMASTIESKGAKPDVEEIKAVVDTEKKEKATIVKLEGEKPEVENTEKKETATTQVKHTAKLAEMERRAAEAVEVKEMNTPSSYSSDKVQSHWTCAVCQVTTTSQTVLDSHLRGKKHMAKCEELKAKKQTPKNNSSSSSSSSSSATSKSGHANQNPNKGTSGAGVNQSKSNQQEKKGQVNNRSQKWRNETEKKYWCSICNVRCPGEIDMASHLGGKRHLSKVQEVFTSFTGVQA